jgi:maltooligosyltrehalose trehalohydrolase
MIGANLIGKNVHFRVWAPEKHSVTLVLENGKGVKTSSYAMKKNEDGFFSATVPASKAGSLYRYQLDNDGNLYSDPANYFQPQGPFGPSQIIDHSAFPWTDQNWTGIHENEHVIYELHIGTFTEAGTWLAAAEELRELKDLGITTIEMMPIADFAGRFGWGYDGVNLFAPCHLYGTPDDLKSFIDKAHEVGLAVILDIVCNHLGPSGNFLHQFSKNYFSKDYKTDWGAGINFDGEHSRPVREYFIQNILYWIEKFHFDGLRFDATQNIKDSSEKYIIQEMIEQAKSRNPDRSLYFAAENEPQNAIFFEPGGYGVTSMWNDDFHHAAVVTLTGRSEAYYTDYKGSPQEFISAAKYGFLYQGQRYEWQEQRRGTPATDIARFRFVHFIENHDQVANSGLGYRIKNVTSPAQYRAMSSLLLLLPQTPMLFQGQEFGSSKPFFYFADHDRELAQTVAKGRTEFLQQFPSLRTEEMLARLPDPGDPQTFVNSKLDLKERLQHGETYQLYKDLLALRREDHWIIHAERIDGAVLGPECFVLRYFGKGEDRLLLVNFGRDLSLRPAPEPLLAPMAGRLWTIAWSSEHPKYGGAGTPHPESTRNWYIPGHAAIWMRPADSGEVKLDIKIQRRPNE